MSFLKFDPFAEALQARPYVHGPIVPTWEWMKDEAHDTESLFSEPRSVATSGYHIPDHLKRVDFPHSPSVSAPQTPRSYIETNRVMRGPPSLNSFRPPESVHCHCEGQHMAHENKLTNHTEELERMKSEMQRQAMLLRQMKMTRQNDSIELKGLIRKNQSDHELQLSLKDAELKQYVDTRLDDEVRTLDENVTLVKEVCETATREARRNNCVYTVSGTFLGASLIYAVYWLVFAPIVVELNPLLHF